VEFQPIVPRQDTGYGSAEISQQGFSRGAGADRLHIRDRWLCDFRPSPKRQSRMRVCLACAYRPVCARRRLWRFWESRFSTHRSHGNCASSKAMASAVVGPGAARSGTAWGVQDTEESDLSAEMFGVGGDFEQCCGTGVKQKVVNDFLVIQPGHSIDRTSRPISFRHQRECPDRAACRHLHRCIASGKNAPESRSNRHILSPLVCVSDGR
jgi:hypothetical protein